jgi:hypothetical protein
VAVIDAQAAIDAAQPWCCVPQGDLWLGVLAALIAVGNGDPMPTADELEEDIACLRCATQSGDVPLLILGAVANITSGTGGGGESGAGSPEGVVTANPGTTYFDTTSAIFWVKRTGAGNTGWYQLVG